MKDWSRLNHPGPRVETPTSNYPTFRCVKCKGRHEVMGSRQRISKVTGKLMRYCKSCWEKMNG